MPIRRPHRWARLGVEVLEDRTVPALFTVTTVNDVTNAADGVLSLREAIAQANARSGQDSIAFAPQVQGQTIRITGGQISITDDLAIQGGAGVTLQGNGASRLLATGDGVNVELSNLTLTGGGGVAQGGAIYALGSLALRRCRVEGNSVTGAGLSAGGGIYAANDDDLTLTDCTFRGNGGAATVLGGGVYTTADTTVTGCTFDANTATVGGGLCASGDFLTVTNSTFSGNQADQGGGLLMSGTTLITLDHCTLTGNAVTGSGAGLFITRAGYRITNSLIAGNQDAEDVWLGGTDGGSAANNVVGTVGGTDASDLVDGTNGNQVGVTDAGLDALADNGGPTRTHALRGGSPARDAGTAATTLFDQRGAGYFRRRGTAADVGAVEADQPTAGGTVRVIAGKAGGTLVLTAAGGPAATTDQAVLVTGLGAGTVQVTGLYGTTLVGGGVFRNVTALQFVGNAGHDWVFLDGVDLPGAVTVSGGDGANDLYLTGTTTVGSLLVTNGAGADNLVMSGTVTIRGAATVLNGGGDSTLQLGTASGSDVQIGGTLSVTNGQGLDSVCLNGGGAVQLQAVRIQNGDGGSAVHLGEDSFHVTRIDQSLTVINGAGADALVMRDAVQIAGGVTVNNGAGDSTFRLGAGSDEIAIDGLVTVTNGAGADSVLLNGGGTVDLGAVTIQNGPGGSLVRLGTQAGDVTRIQGALTVAAGAGADAVDLNGGGRVEIGGPVSLATGAGAGQVTAGVNGGDVTLINGGLTWTGGADADTFRANGTRLGLGGSLTLNLGDGVNSTRLSSQAVIVGGGVTVTGGAGDDDFSTIDSQAVTVTGDVALNLGAGTNFALLVSPNGTTTVGGRLVVTGQGGQGTARLYRVRVLGASAFALSGGANALYVDNCAFGGAFTYQGGAAADHVAIETGSSAGETTFAGRVTIATGAGDDTLTVGLAGDAANWALFLQGATFDGGLGTDTLAYRSGRANQFGRWAPVVVGWEAGDRDGGRAR